MTIVLFAGLGTALYGVVLFLTSLFLILLVLVQRGRGGGLAGAFGGTGGQSAFGTKAGDTFTRVTVGLASFWIVLCIVGVKFAGTAEEGLMSSAPDVAPVTANDLESDLAEPGMNAPLAETPASDGSSSSEPAGSPDPPTTAPSETTDE